MYPYTGERVTPVYSCAVEWTDIRAHYEKLFQEAKKRGETQESVAARGGLRQNKISRLRTIEKLGPQVETFARAVEGLGLTVSSFFAQIERDSLGQSVHEKSSLKVHTEAAKNEPRGGVPSGPDSLVRGADSGEPISLDTFEQLGRAFGRTFAEQMRLGQVSQQPPTPRRAQSKTRKADSGHADGRRRGRSR